jgi:4-hydroxyphenylpyruvate dioxygenase
MQFNGEGIQHVALICDDLLATIDSLQMAGVPLMSAPNEVYYEMLDERLPGHGQPVHELARAASSSTARPRAASRGCCCRSSRRRCSAGVLRVHPAQGDEGFGEGNFRALFESIERDQVRRGVIKADA